MTLTPERAREIVRAQSQWPHWGNYDKFMTDAERAAVRERFQTAQSGNITVASIVHRAARADMFEARPDFDERDVELARERLAEWNENKGPRVGDWIEMLDGTTRRFTHHWGDSIQTTIANNVDASFYFYGDHMSFSGSLDRAIPLAEIEPTGDTKNGTAWFFHHNQAGGGRGVYFTVPCRVYHQVKR